MAGVTKKANISVTARAIDFVSRFGTNFEALREIMGISRPIQKAPGTKLRVVTGSVSLESGAVGEGETIPYSTATVTESDLTDLTFEKYRMGVTLEAIDKYGYDVAIQKTDDALLNQLRGNVMGKFYTFLSTGTLTADAETFQMALATAKGQVLNKFKGMNKSVTDVVAFVNVLDFYEYVGAANITVQTMFGMQYVKDFMGYSVVFLEDSSKVARNKVYATPVENIVCYYANPADSDYARAGLEFITDGVTNLIGVHKEGNYGTAVADTFAIIGMVLYAEYLNGIANVTIGEEVSPSSGE